GAAFLAGGAALLAYAFSACSYDALHSDIQVLVDGLPVSAIRGHVTLTTTNGDSEEYFPRVPPGGGLELDLAAPSSGTYTVSVQVQAFDALDNTVADGTTSGSGTFPASTPLSLALHISAVASDGAFGSRCKADD